MPDTWFLPFSNKLFDSWYSISLEEYRQCTQPMRMVMPANAFLGTFLGGGAILSHVWNNRPFYTGAKVLQKQLQ